MTTNQTTPDIAPHDEQAVRPTTPVRRMLALGASNARLMARNRLTAFYAVAMPLAPLFFLFASDRGDVGVGAVIATIVVLMALLFPVYYNVLSLVVTRRDELVLKRLRTGETTDRELVLSLVLPGAVVAAVVAFAAVPLGIALGQPAPTNAVVYVLTVALGVALLAALAIWTAAWTRNAEAAQLTSLPVFLILSLGFSAQGLPDVARNVVDLTPGGAVDALVRIGWFGQTRTDTVDLAASWGAAASPMLVLVAWTAVALWAGQRWMRWEPRR